MRAGVRGANSLYGGTSFRYMVDMAVCIEPGCGQSRGGRFRRCNACRNSMKRYGLSSIGRQEMLASQDGLCALCERPICFNGGTKSGSAVIDHCHATNVVRGVICIRCNLLVAHIDTCAISLSDLASYLGVAQSAEHRFRESGAVGSSPAT